MTGDSAVFEFLARYGVAPVLVAGWIPVVKHFLGMWKARRNPLSLAIVGFSGYAIFTLAKGLGYHVPDVSITLMNGAALLNFYIARHRASKKFPESRGPRNG